MTLRLECLKLAKNLLEDRPTYNQMSAMGGVTRNGPAPGEVINLAEKLYRFVMEDPEGMAAVDELAALRKLRDQLKATAS